MRWFTFLAGVAAGVLLASPRSGPGAARRQPAGDAGQGASGGPAARPRGPGLTNVSDWDGVSYLPPRTDAQVRERIVSQIGRTIGNPQAIQVTVDGGCVTLRGQVQGRDAILLMAEVESTAGVVSVRNQLEIQGAPDAAAAPTAQGGVAGTVRAQTSAS